MTKETAEKKRACSFFGLQGIRDAARGNEGALTEGERKHLLQCPGCRKRVKAARKVYDTLNGMLERGELDSSTRLR